MAADQHTPNSTLTTAQQGGGKVACDKPAPTDDATAAMQQGKSVAHLLETIDEKQRQGGYYWFIYRLTHPKADSDKPFKDKGFTVYYPLVDVTYHDSRGRVVTQQKPKLLNYIFVLATEAQVEDLRFSDIRYTPMRRYLSTQELNALNDPKNREKRLEVNGKLVIETLNTCRWQKVPFSQMIRLIRYNEIVDGPVSLVKADDDLLDKGDLVHIINGPFKGLDGILRTSERMSGGSVFIGLAYRITTDKKGREQQVPVFGVETIRLSDQDYKVKEFRKGKKHFFLKIESFTKVLDAAIQNRLDSKSGTVTDTVLRNKLHSFLFRYDELTNLTRINATKLYVVCYAASTLLNVEVQAKLYKKKWHDLGKPTAKINEFIEEWTDKIEKMIVEEKDEEKKKKEEETKQSNGETTISVTKIKQEQVQLQEHIQEKKEEQNQKNKEKADPDTGTQPSSKVKVHVVGKRVYTRVKAPTTVEQ